MPCPTLGDVCLVHSMSKMQKTVQASGCANVKSTLDINLFCLLHQEASIKIISYLLMSYPYTKFRTSSRKLTGQERFSQGERKRERCHSRKDQNLAKGMKWNGATR